MSAGALLHMCWHHAPRLHAQRVGTSTNCPVMFTLTRRLEQAALSQQLLQAQPAGLHPFWPPARQ